MSWSRVVVSLLDANGAPKPFVAYTDGTNFSFAHPLVDSTGAIVDPATSENQATELTILSAIQTSVAAAIPAGGNTIGAVSSAASATNGSSSYSAAGGNGNPLLTNSALQLKAGAGSLYSLNLFNGGSADAYVQIFDALSAGVNLGTTIPKLSFWIPAGGAVDKELTGEAKAAFATGITIAATTTATGAGAPATGVLANIFFK